MKTDVKKYLHLKKCISVRNGKYFVALGQRLCVEDESMVESEEDSKSFSSKTI